MKNENTYSDTALLASVLAEDESIRNDVQEKISESELVSHLVNLRHDSNLSQSAMAKRMKCHPSKISRIESGSDFNLKWGEIVEYCHAAEFNVSVFFERSEEDLPAATRIKNSVLRIHRDLNELAAIAKSLGDNDEITKKISMFYGEVLFNFMMRNTENCESAGFTIPHDELPDSTSKKHSKPEANSNLELIEAH